jgi:Flp pilus assembly protein CpaB
VGSLPSGLRPRIGRRRRPLARWAVTALLAVVAGGLAASVVARAEDARAAFGTLRSVPVAERTLEPGEVLAAADVVTRSLPDVLLPDGVADDPVGRVVADVVLAGEVVMDARLAGAGSGPGPLLEPGHRAVALPRDERTVSLAVGDRVDVLAPDGAASGARRVGRAARVLAVDPVTVTLEVGAAEAPAVSRAVLDGAVALALVGPGG